MIAPLLSFTVLATLIWMHTINKASQEHISDLQSRNAWLYDQNHQQAQRIKELEQKCQ